MEEKDKNNKKSKRDKEEEQHEEQLQEVSLSQSSPYKPTMVIEVCCHCQEFFVAIKVCCCTKIFWPFFF